MQNTARIGKTLIVQNSKQAMENQVCYNPAEKSKGPDLPYLKPALSDPSATYHKLKEQNLGSWVHVTAV